METQQQKIRMSDSEIAHKLRNPLTTIMGYAQLLLKKCEKPGLEKEVSWLEKIYQESERLNKMIDEYLGEKHKTEENPDKN